MKSFIMQYNLSCKRSPTVAGGPDLGCHSCSNTHVGVFWPVPVRPKNLILHDLLMQSCFRCSKFEFATAGTSNEDPFLLTLWGEVKASQLVIFKFIFTYPVLSCGTHLHTSWSENYWKKFPWSGFRLDQAEQYGGIENFFRILKSNIFRTWNETITMCFIRWRYFSMWGRTRLVKTECCVAWVVVSKQQMHVEMQTCVRFPVCAPLCQPTQMF